MTFFKWHFILALVPFGSNDIGFGVTFAELKWSAWKDCEVPTKADLSDLFLNVHQEGCWNNRSYNKTQRLTGTLLELLPRSLFCELRNSSAVVVVLLRGAVAEQTGLDLIPPILSILAGKH